MSSNKGDSVLGTVRFRLTLWQAGLFSAFALILFLSEDHLLSSHLLSRTDDEMLAQVRQFTALYEEFGLQALQDEFDREASATGVEDLVLILRSPKLSVLASSDRAAWIDVGLDRLDLASMAAGDVWHRTLPLRDGRRLARVADARTRDGNLLQVGRSLAQDRAVLTAYRRVFALVVLAMLLFGVCLAWMLTRQAMSGVEKVTRTARRIGETDLSARVPASDPGREIRDLVDAFNEMLERIGQLVTEMREVTDNVAHDLRGSLTRIRGLGEAIVLTSSAQAEHRENAGAIVEECDRLALVVDTMLEIAETKSGVATVTLGDVDLVDVARQACDLFDAVAEDKGVSLHLNASSERGVVGGDLRRLQRAVANLIDNAVKYTPSDGSVRVNVSADAEQVVLEVSDTGIGIAAQDVPRVFDRFFRTDSSRSTRGNGLGLSLADAIVRRHGGTISVDSTPGAGSRFCIVLPATHAAAAGRADTKHG